jgi:sugar lactone lactonase YvrE
MTRRLLTGLLSLSLSACPTPPGACPTEGTGSIVVTFSGLPAGTTGTVTLEGASSQTVTMSQTVTAGAGRFQVRAERVTTSDPLVRSVYAPTLSAQTFCLGSGTSQAVSVTWEKVPTSNRLWASSSAGGAGNLHGFDSASLAMTGMAASGWSGDVPGSGAVAFDQEGNLWALGNTTEDPDVVRYPASAFGQRTAARPDRRFNVSAIMGCVPRRNALAFDKAGNLYLASPCMRQVYRLSAASLSAPAGSTDPVVLTPAATLGGFTSTDGLAFDKDGALFAADPMAREVLRFEAPALLGATASPSLRLRAKASDLPADTSVLGVQSLAFDKDGNLFAFDFGSSNVVYFFPAGQLAPAGAAVKTVIPGARMTVSVTGIPDGMAFDEGGGLWMPLGQGTLVRFSAAQLLLSTGAGAPTPPERTLTGTSLGYASGPAFYTAPAGLPLFQAMP